MKKINIIEQTDPIFLFKKLANTKRFLKPITVNNKESFINKFYSQLEKSKDFLIKNYALKLENQFYFEIEITYNIPLKAISCYGNGLSTVFRIINDDIDFFGKDIENKKEFEVFLLSMPLPKKIIPIELKLIQNVLDIETTFNYRLKN